ncbi:MAG: patatin-like phospholipase family protein [Thermoleophilaceae bacterium]|nr:patatin-like phospholipase family protein [Thermoleophilaceae bacterium]
MSNPLKILSIDGGGIRGIIPATVLVEVERLTGRPVAETFDIVAGTSTGGILALALTLPSESSRPAWSARDLVSLYEREGPSIFSRSLHHKIHSAGGLLDERYPSDGLEGAFDEYFGDARLRDALCDVLVTAYEIEQRTTFFFKSASARADERDDYAMRDAALATSAAPTYFQPVKVERGSGRPYLALVDGGVFANNPAMCAYAEALKRDAGTRARGAGAEVLLVSLGTGELTRRLAWERAKDWGLLAWAKPILDVVFDGVGDATDHHLAQLLGRDESYYRFQTELDAASDDMDDASEGNLQRLKQEAEGLVRDNRERLEEACGKLG